MVPRSMGLVIINGYCGMPAAGSAPRAANQTAAPYSAQGYGQQARDTPRPANGCRTHHIAYTRTSDPSYAALPCFSRQSP
jgi:hypothetical protein